jgi:NDP-sugar pyrophosphorylase family protein
VEREERFVAYVSPGYWIDIGTPIKYQQVHRDIMDGRFPAAPFGDRSAASTVVAASATIADDVTLEGPCFVDEGVVIETGSHIGPYTVLGRECTIREGARLDGAIVWPYTDIEREARLHDAILGRRCHVGRHAWLGAGTILGDESIVTDYSRTLA